MSGPPAGTVIRNDQTGEQMQFDGRKWVPFGTSGAGGDYTGKLTSEDAKLLGEYRTASINANGLNQTLDQFNAANQVAATGPLNAPSWEFFGVRPFAAFASPELKAMESAQSVGTSQMHQTPGPMTDSDAKLYRQALPSPALTGPANDRISDDLRIRNARTIARAQAADEYAMANGTLRGFDAAFDQWWQQNGLRPGQPVTQSPAPSETPSPGQRGGIPVQRAPATPVRPGMEPAIGRGRGVGGQRVTDDIDRRFRGEVMAELMRRGFSAQEAEQRFEQSLRTPEVQAFRGQYRQAKRGGQQVQRGGDVRQMSDDELRKLAGVR